MYRLALLGRIAEGRQCGRGLQTRTTCVVAPQTPLKRAQRLLVDTITTVPRLLLCFSGCGCGRGRLTSSTAFVYVQAFAVVKTISMLIITHRYLTLGNSLATPTHITCTCHRQPGFRDLVCHNSAHSARSGQVLASPQCSAGQQGSTIRNSPRRYWLCFRPVRTERRAVLLRPVHPVHTTMSQTRAQLTASRLALAVKRGFRGSEPLATDEEVLEALEAAQHASGVVASEAELYKCYLFVSASTHCSACCLLSDVV